MYKSALIVLGILCSHSAHAEKLIVDAFHDNQTRLINTKLAESVAYVSVYNLNAPDNLEKQLSTGLSKNPELAQKQAQERIAAGGHKLKKSFQDAYEGSMLAMKYNIQKLPAVVFNAGKGGVIYGVSDVNKAIRIYKERGGK